MRGLEIILPVVQIEMASNLLRALNENTTLPAKVIIMDDSDFGFTPLPETKYPVVYRRTGERGQVNETFNIGMRLAAGSEFAVLFNDDVEIHPYLLENIVQAFDDGKKFGALSPATVQSIREVGADREPKYSILRLREGSIMAFRTSVFNQIPPIPEEMRVFYSDDWWWNHILRLGYLWARIDSSRIYHYVSVSVDQRGFSKFMELDREVFMRLMGGRAHLPRRYRKGYQGFGPGVARELV